VSDVVVEFPGLTSAEVVAEVDVDDVLAELEVSMELLDVSLDVIVDEIFADVVDTA